MTNETKKRIRTEFVVQTIGKQAALLAEQYATAPLSHTGRTAEEANRARCDLLKMTIGGLAGEFPDLAGVAKAEETAAQLIRNGLPKHDVTASVKFVTIRLSHADYRIYRETSGCPAGSVRVCRTWQSREILTGLSSRGLAELLPALDEAMPEIDRNVRELAEQMKALEKRELAAFRARQIEDHTVRTLVAEFLKPLLIDCAFVIDDGKVKLNLAKELAGEVVLPLEDLPAFLSDPAKVEASLAPVEPTLQTGPFGWRKPQPWDLIF